PKKPLCPNRQGGHGREHTECCEKHIAGACIVRYGRIEEHSEADPSQFESHSDDYYARNYGREELAEAVDQPAHGDLACPGKDHHAACHRKSKSGRSRHSRGEISRRNDRRAKVPRADPPEA